MYDDYTVYVHIYMYNIQRFAGAPPCIVIIDIYLSMYISAVAWQCTTPNVADDVHEIYMYVDVWVTSHRFSFILHMTAGKMKCLFLF